MSTIDEVKQKTDIVEVARQYVSLTKTGRTFRALCPFHSEKHPSFYIYPEQQTWHCFGACNTGGDVFSLVMKKEGMDFGEALRILAQRAGISLPTRDEPGAEAKKKERLYLANQAAAQYFHNLLLHSPIGERAHSYVTSRGLSTKAITGFQLGFSPNSWSALKEHLVERGYTEPELVTAGLVIEAESGGTHDRFRNRLMFPIFDIRGRVTGFGGRALDDSQPKYLNSPQTPMFDKSSTLYGINLAADAIRQQDMAVIVEGYIDAVTANQYGFNNVIASMGTSVTEKQITILKKLTRNIAFALDADEAGDEAMLRGVSYENTLGAEVRVIILPRGKDPDEVIKEDARIWQRLAEEALPVVDYAFNMITSRLDLTTANGKSSAVEKLLPIVAEIKDNTRRDHYMTELAELTGVSYRHLEEVLADYIVKNKKSTPEPAARAQRSPLSSRREEYCLALLLQHPELKARSELLPEYFENSENREIFTIWQKTDNLQSLKEKLDISIHEHLDSLITMNPLPNQIENKFADSVLRLREKFLRNLEANRGEVLAQEAESGGTAAELAKLEEQGIEISSQLKEVYTRKAAKRGTREVR